MKLQEQLKNIKKIMGINENKQTYDYACAMLYFNEDSIDAITKLIDPEDLYTEGESFGIETEPHCTLLYGLHDDEVSPDEVSNIIQNRTFSTCKGHNISCFNNEKYDVLKYDVMGDGLNDTNKELTQFPYTTDYPDYHPHATIAYLKPGMGQKYIDMISDQHDQIDLVPQYGVYSRPSGEKIKIPVRID